LELPNPSPPEISPYIVVGLGNVSRSLESLSRKSKPSEPSLADSERNSQSQESAPNEGKDEKISAPLTGLEGDLFRCHFSAVFVLSSTLPSILQEHLPQLVATASLAHPLLPATRLVRLPKGCDSRLCTVLGLQRVSVIGILDGAPHSKSLLHFIRAHVPEIQIPWHEEARKNKYLPVKIKAVETFGWVAEKESKSS
jgi:ribonuclease P/MRP protein subunit POP3